MILKAGTYRFNDVLTDFPNIIYNVDVSVTFNVTGEGQTIEFKGFYVNAGILFDYLMEDDTYFTSYNFEKAVWETDILQLHTITADTEVDDTFGTWYITNTNYNEVNATPIATIEYNGQTIAELNAGETATLSCEGKKMLTDLVIKINEVEVEKGEGTVIYKHEFDLGEIEGGNAKIYTYNTSLEPLKNVVGMMMTPLDHNFMGIYLTISMGGSLPMDITLPVFQVALDGGLVIGVLRDGEPYAFTVDADYNTGTETITKL